MRWSKEYREATTQKSRGSVWWHCPCVRSDKDGINRWNRERQAKYEIPVGVNRTEDGMCKKGGQMWIPGGSTRPKLRITVDAHCSDRGNWAYDATTEIVSESCLLPGFSRDTREASRYHISCIVSRTGERASWPSSFTQLVSKPNEVVHKKFLYKGLAQRWEMEYTLLILYRISWYARLYQCVNAESDATTNALPNQVSSFEYIGWSITNQGFQFMVALMTSHTREARKRHYFTAPTCPWATKT